MSTFRYCTGTEWPGIHLGCHLLSNDQQVGDRCAGSYLQSHGTYLMCTGTIVVPDAEQQTVMHAAWKLGGWNAVADIVEQVTGLNVVRLA